MVPQFVADTARAAAPGKDNILVVLEMTGGNDGLNTVIPYADDLYHKARPTLRHKKDQVVRLDDHVGLQSRHERLPAAVEPGTARGRAGRRLSEPRPLALRVDGHLAVGRSARASSRPAGWAAAPANCKGRAAACRSCTSAPAGCRSPSRAAGRRGQRQRPPDLPPRARRRHRSPSRRPGASCSKNWPPPRASAERHLCIRPPAAGADPDQRRTPARIAARSKTFGKTRVFGPGWLLRPKSLPSSCNSSPA